MTDPQQPNPNTPTEPTQQDTNTAAPNNVTHQDRHAGQSAAGPIARWAIHRHLYDWVLGFAHKSYATTALFILSFAESSFFPIPPDVLLAPMCMSKRKRALTFAGVTTIASVLGALVGYAIGWGAWEAFAPLLYNYVPGFTEDKFATVESWYEAWGVWVLFIAAFTPIPYKVFTIAGGVFGQPLLPFIIVSLIGRGLRFYLVAGLFRWIGPTAMPLIDRYFNRLCIAGAAILIAAVLIWKTLHDSAATSLAE